MIIEAHRRGLLHRIRSTLHYNYNCSDFGGDALEVPVIVARLSCVCRLTVHRLAARTLIRSLEMEGEVENKNVKEEVVEVSVQSGVSSSFTAFIGVNKDAGEVIQGPLLLRNISTAGKCHSSKNYIPGVFTTGLRMKQIFVTMSAASICI